MDAIVSVLNERMIALLRKGFMNHDKSHERPAVRGFRLFMQEQGRKEGRLEGVAEGVAQGVVEGKRSALITLLEARGLSISARERAIIVACSDPVALDQWIAVAANASSSAEVLRPAPKTAAPRSRAKRAATPRATTSRKPARASKP